MARLIRGGTGGDLRESLEKALGEDGSSYERLHNLIFKGYIDRAVPNYSGIRDDRDYLDVMHSLRSINYNADDEMLVVGYEDIAKDQGVIENFRKSNSKYYTMATFMKNIDLEGYQLIKTHINDGVLQFGAALEELATGDRGIEYMTQLRHANQYVRNLFVRRFVEVMTDGTKTDLLPDEIRAMERTPQQGKTLSGPEKFGRLLASNVVERPAGGYEVPVRDLIILSNRAYSKAEPPEAV